MPEIKSLADSEVNAPLDLELRTLLATCFTKPGDEVFKERRYFNEPPQQRWVAREEGVLAAHLAVHIKDIKCGELVLKIGGIAEVCVHPNYRGKKYVNHLLLEAHTWLKSKNVLFSVLFGNPQIYSSSGYRPFNNELYYFDTKTGQWLVQASHAGMVLCLGEQAWPEGRINLQGPLF